MSTLDPAVHDIEEFYDEARKLRQDIRSGDKAVQDAAVNRMRIIPGWRSLTDEDIASTPIPLKTGKLVIALEHGFPSWGDLRMKSTSFRGEKMKNSSGVFLLCCLSFILSACSSNETTTDIYKPTPMKTPLAFEKVSFDQIDGWNQDRITQAFPAFMKSIPKIENRPHWVDVCLKAKQVDPKNEQEVRAFFETEFQAYRVTDKEGNSTGPITGYYEPLLRGSRTKSDLYRYPVYTRPKDLIKIELTSQYPELKHHRLRGRLENEKIVPYFTRREIDSFKEPLKGNEIFWVESRVELYFLHVQGSGRIQLDTGEIVKVGYHDMNGFPYTSIGKLLVTLGEIAAEDISMQSIKKWFLEHPERFEEVCFTNDRYNFFREMPAESDGPFGSLNVALTPERSVAVDRRHIELGTPIFISTVYPDTRQVFKKLTMAQDTGAAIVGRIRADLFWGFGADAENRAGLMKEAGSVWVLLPHGVSPGVGDVE